MKISVTRSGGFAGITEPVGQLDTESLPPALAAEAERRIRDSKFFELPAEVPGGELGADLYRYEVTVQDGPRVHAVTYIEGPGPLSQLVEWVQQVQRS